MNHSCHPPTLVGLTIPQQPDWECGVCGSVWRDWSAGAVRYWAQVVGPRALQEIPDGPPLSEHPLKVKLRTAVYASPEGERKTAESKKESPS